MQNSGCCRLECGGDGGFLEDVALGIDLAHAVGAHLPVPRGVEVDAGGDDQAIERGDRAIERIEVERGGFAAGRLDGLAVLLPALADDILGAGDEDAGSRGSGVGHAPMLATEARQHHGRCTADVPGR